jgi:hypothetical protein
MEIPDQARRGERVEGGGDELQKRYINIGSYIFAWICKILPDDGATVRVMRYESSVEAKWNGWQLFFLYSRVFALS